MAYPPHRHVQPQPDRDGHIAVLATLQCAIMAAMEELEIHSKVGFVTAKDLVSTNLF